MALTAVLAWASVLEGLAPGAPGIAAEFTAYTVEIACLVDALLG